MVGSEFREKRKGKERSQNFKGSTDRGCQSDRGGQLPWVWRKAQVTPGDGTSRGVPVYDADCLKASAEGHA